MEFITIKIYLEIYGYKSPPLKEIYVQMNTNLFALWLDIRNLKKKLRNLLYDIHLKLFKIIFTQAKIILSYNNVL